MNSILPYTAGIIDGEGSITLSRLSSNQYRVPVVSVTNTSSEIINFLRTNFGGIIVNQKTYQVHHRKAWIWRVTYNSAIDFLQQIRPFLLHEDKIYRTDLIINEYKNVTKRNGKYSSEELKNKLDFEERFIHPSIA